MTTEHKTSEPDDADNILVNLINETVNGKLRWGFQPPSTAQANRGSTHLVLRMRRNVFRLTARRDGNKKVNFTIERIETDGGFLTDLFRLATGVSE